MKMRNLLPAALVVFVTSTASLLAVAEDGVVKEDQQRVEQDKQAIQKDKQDIKRADENIAKDKSSGNVDQLRKDRQARSEARRNKRQDKHRLHHDRGDKKHDQSNP